jgi:hypothetical protein
MERRPKDDNPDYPTDITHRLQAPAAINTRLQPNHTREPGPTVTTHAITARRGLMIGTGEVDCYGDRVRQFEQPPERVDALKSSRQTGSRALCRLGVLERASVAVGGALFAVEGVEVLVVRDAALTAG